MKQHGLTLCLIILVCILLVSSQVLLKLALQRAAVHSTGFLLLLTALPRLWTFWLAFASMAAAVALWVAVLREAPLSVVYPMISLSYVLMIPVARVFLKEAVTVTGVAGAVIIVLGVTVLSRAM